MCSCTLVSGLFETYPGFDFISDTMSKWNLQQPLIQFPLCIFWWLVCRLRATVAHRGFPKKVDHLTPTSVHKHKVSQSTEVPLQTSVFYLNLLPIRAQVVDTEAKKKPLHTSTVSFVHLPPAAPEASWEMESFHRVLAHYQGFHQPVVLGTPPKERSGIIQHVQWSNNS